MTAGFLTRTSPSQQGQLDLILARFHLEGEAAGVVGRDLLLFAGVDVDDLDRASVDGAGPFGSADGAADRAVGLRRTRASCRSPGCPPGIPPARTPGRPTARRSLSGCDERASVWRAVPRPQILQSEGHGAWGQAPADCRRGPGKGSHIYTSLVFSLIRTDRGWVSECAETLDRTEVSVIHPRGTPLAILCRAKRGPLPDAPVVSIVVPCFNHGRYLREALDSIGAPLVRTEIVVIDDGSTDSTPEVVATFETANEFRCVRQANGGLAAARNRGLAREPGALRHLSRRGRPAVARPRSISAPPSSTSTRSVRSSSAAA